MEVLKHSRCLRISLRTLFAVVTGICVSLGWVVSQWQIVQHRAAYQPLFNSQSSLKEVFDMDAGTKASIGWARSLLGDYPLNTLMYSPERDQEGVELRAVRRLFPEAQIWGWPLHGFPRPANLPKELEPLPDTHRLMY